MLIFLRNVAKRLGMIILCISINEKQRVNTPNPKM